MCLFGVCTFIGIYDKTIVFRMRYSEHKSVSLIKKEPIIFIGFGALDENRTRVFSLGS